MVACQNDDIAIGAHHAFRDVGDSKERDSWLALPITGCDGVPKSGQAWVRHRRLAATIYSPPCSQRRSLSGNLAPASIRIGDLDGDRNRQYCTPETLR